MKQRFDFVTSTANSAFTVPELLEFLADAVRFVEQDEFLCDAAPDLRRAVDKIAMTQAVALDVMREEDAGMGNRRMADFAPRRKLC